MNANCNTLTIITTSTLGSDFYKGWHYTQNPFINKVDHWLQIQSSLRQIIIFMRPPLLFHMFILKKHHLCPIYLNKKLTYYNGASLSRKTLFLYSSFARVGFRIDCMIKLGIFHSPFIYGIIFGFKWWQLSYMCLSMCKVVHFLFIFK